MYDVLLEAYAKADNVTVSADTSVGSDQATVYPFVCVIAIRCATMPRSHTV
jgi:hypothetical protein